jgi:hypothetical protein
MFDKIILKLPMSTSIANFCMHNKKICKIYGQLIIKLGKGTLAIIHMII